MRVPSASDFAEAGPFNEMVVMGVLAVRLQDLNMELEWDGEKMEFTNIPEDATIKTVIKRAVTRVFAPEVNQVSDGYLCQGRWVYGNVALKNKTAGIYASKAGATG